MSSQLDRVEAKVAALIAEGLKLKRQNKALRESRERARTDLEWSRDALEDLRQKFKWLERRQMADRKEKDEVQSRLGILYKVLENNGLS